MGLPAAHVCPKNDVFAPVLVAISQFCGCLSRGGHMFFCRRVSGPGIFMWIKYVKRMP